MAVDINIEDLTNGSLGISNEWSGTGVFDKLIYAVNQNVKGEYLNGRITGTDYSNVYLGSMQAVIAQSMQYLLQEQQTEAQIDLLREQQKGAYVERIIKDKEAVALGLDDTLLMAKNTLDTTDDYVYTPYYEETI